MSGHTATPGPWKIRKTRLGFEITGIHGIGVADVGEDCISNSTGFYYRVSADECAANARLIADAPKTKRDRDDLLAAAKNLMVEIKNLYGFYGDCPFYYSDIEAAIARAEGSEENIK